MIELIIFEKYSSLFIEFAKILIPSFITYLVTRYTINRPKQYEIRFKQFHSVYLPLYLLCKQLLSDISNIQNVKIFIKKADKLLYKNYPLIFPKTEKLLLKLKNQVENNQPINSSINNFIYQIEYDYEKLKRELGYPTDSFVDFFTRMNKIDKFFYVSSFIFLIIGIYCGANFFVLLFSSYIAKALFFLILSIPSFFLSYLMYYARS